MTRPRRRVYVHLTSTGPQETPDRFERGLVGFSRCHRVSITRTLRVEARLASLVLRHLVLGVLLTPCSRSSSISAPIRSRNGHHPRSVSARDLRESPKACDASSASRAETPSTPTRRRGKRRRVISFSRSFTYVHHFSHWRAAERRTSVPSRATSTSTSTSLEKPSWVTTLGGVRNRADSRPSRQRRTREARSSN